MEPPRDLEDLRRRHREAADALRDHPRSPGHYVEAARTAEAAGLKGEAYGFFERALMLDPSRVELAHGMRANAADPAQLARADQLVRRPHSLFEALPAVFLYPFSGSSAAIIVLGGLVLALVRVIQKLSAFPWASYAAGGILLAYMSAYYVSILNATASGEDDLPHWPDFHDVWALVLDVLKFSLAHLVSFLPLLIVTVGFLLWTFDAESLERWLMPDTQTRYIGERPAEPTLSGAAGCLGFLAVGVALFAAGLVYLPMALTANCVFGTMFACINPFFIVRSMLREPGYYAFCAFGYFFIGIVATLLGWVYNLSWTAFLLGTIPGMILEMYAIAAQMRLLGMYYRYSQGRLGWLVES